jgi:hypothetical protein
MRRPSASRCAPALTQLDEHTRTKARQLDDTYHQLASVQQRLNAQRDTLAFLRGTLEALAVEDDDEVFARAVVQHFCEVFEVDSLQSHAARRASRAADRGASRHGPAGGRACARPARPGCGGLGRAPSQTRAHASDR